MYIINFIFLILGLMFSIFKIVIQSKERVLKGGFIRESYQNNNNQNNNNQNNNNQNNNHD
jgi:hypothetical protein